MPNKDETLHDGSDSGLGEKGEVTHYEQKGDIAADPSNFAHMSAEDRATALRVAYDADPGPALASYRYLCFFMTCMVVIVNSCDTGFDTTIMSSVNSMRTFQNFFGLESATKGTGIVFVSNELVLQLLTVQGIYTVGGVCAFFPNIILPDLIGRRYSMAYGNTLLM